MKNTEEIEIENNEDLLEHYDFDYSKAKPNRFALLFAEKNGLIKLDPEIQKVFRNSDEVNKALNAFIVAIPKHKIRKNKKAT
jgi:hypothetical protein